MYNYAENRNSMQTYYPQRYNGGPSYLHGDITAVMESRNRDEASQVFPVADV